MKAVSGVTVTVFVGGISYFLGLGFQIPPGSEGFRFLATFGGIAGFGVGAVFLKLGKKLGPICLSLLIFIMLLIGSLAAIWYMTLIATGADPGVRLNMELAGLLTLTFFCLGSVIPLSGVSFGT